MGIEYQRLRAPANSGQILQIPSIAAAPDLVRANQRLLRSHDGSTFGVDFQTLRRAARFDLVQSALAHTGRYLTPAANANDGNDEPLPIIMSGHQPTLYHPGVWFKNFALSEIADAAGGIAINLIVDNDLCTAKSISVPAGSNLAPRIERVAFDYGGLMLPWECQTITRPDLFDSFGRRVQEAIHPLVDTPLIVAFWKRVRNLIKEFPNPGLAFAAARHSLEKVQGLNTLEVPLSEVVDSPSFRTFAALLLERHQEFRDAYNDELISYREIHGIRNSQQPVPALAIADDPATGLSAAQTTWTEVPFWVWQASDPVRRRLYSRQVAEDRMEFTDLHAWQDSCSTDRIPEFLRDCERGGLVIRPRALITTLYSRLVLSDLFLHGIGGAKYDQLTDAIAERFFAFSLPEFMVITATVQLPVALPEATEATLLAADKRIRDLHWHPEWFVDKDGQTGELVRAKAELVAQIPVKGERQAWHKRMAEINCHLRRRVTAQLKRAVKARDQIKSDLDARQMLGSREFAWPLFPGDLPEQLRRLAREPSGTTPEPVK